MDSVESARPRAEAIVVTGVPGAGKTTLGLSLARGLNAPFLSLDLVKEHLYELHAGGLVGYELRLAAESELRSGLVDAIGAVVVDVWVAPDRDSQRIAALFRSSTASTLEVLCRVPAEVAVDRYSRRVRTAPHLPADRRTLQRIEDAADVLSPLGIGRCVEVDTSHCVDIGKLIDRLRGQG